MPSYSAREDDTTSSIPCVNLLVCGVLGNLKSMDEYGVIRPVLSVEKRSRLPRIGLRPVTGAHCFKRTAAVPFPASFRTPARV